MTKPWVPPLCALTVLLGLLLHLSAWPLLGLGAAALGVLVLAARRRLAAGRPTWIETGLGLGAAVLLALAVFAGGPGGLDSPKPEVHGPLLRRLAIVLALASAVGLALLAALPLTSRLELTCDGEPPALPPAGRGVWVVAVVAVAWQSVVLFTAGAPLVQIDSWVNFNEPPFFTFWPQSPHHPPVYPVLLKAGGWGPHALAWLWFVTVLQHLLLVPVALAVERLVRGTTGSAAAAAAAGVVVAISGPLALYAQSIMSEVVSISLVVVAFAILHEAPRRGHPLRWIALAGVCAALGTLTRQAMQAWFLAGAIAIALGPLRPRKTAVGVFLLGALLPVGAQVVHNYTFQGRAVLTAATGRNLVYRVVLDMPDLTDPSAAPDDELERARRLIWRERDNLWLGPYRALETELGWSDTKIDKTIQRFYVQQILRHPGVFAEVTLSNVATLLTVHERFDTAAARHNALEQRRSEQGWAAIPNVPAPPAALDRFAELRLTTRLGFLLLAFAAPLLAVGAARRLALAALISAGYFIALPALVEEPVPRYRLPAVPFLCIAAGVALAALRDRLRPAPSEEPAS